MVADTVVIGCRLVTGVLDVSQTSERFSFHATTRQERLLPPGSTEVCLFLVKGKKVNTNYQDFWERDEIQYLTMDSSCTMKTGFQESLFKLCILNTTLTLA